MRLRRGTSPHTSNGEQGAVLVESSIVSVLLLMMIAGVIEYSAFLNSVNELAGSVRSRVRISAITDENGNVANDWEILQALLEKEGGRRNDVTRVVIYRANSNDGAPPSDCVSGTPSPTSECDVFSSTDLASLSTLLHNTRVDSKPIHVG
jgi:hypothetical protein